MRHEALYHPRANAIEEANCPPQDATQAPTSDLGQIRSDSLDVMHDPTRRMAIDAPAVLETIPEDTVHCTVDVVQRAFGAKVARIHLLDGTGQWTHLDTGNSGGGSIPFDNAACQYVLDQYRALAIPDLLTDALFRDCPAVIDGETMRFYAGVPLTTSNGQSIGVLSLLDPTPDFGFDQAARRLLERLAEIVVQNMALRTAKASTRANLRRAVDEDPVTGLASRSELLLRLQRLIEDDHGAHYPVAVMELRVRCIDRVEQAFGATTLNQLHRDVAGRLTALAKPGETIGRPDDHGFTIVARTNDRESTPLADRAASRAREFMDAFTRPFDLVGFPFHLEVSAGIARAPADSAYAHELLGMAHEAALRAGKLRPGRIAYPDHDAVVAERRKLSLEGRLRRAVAEGDLAVHFQPIMALAHGGATVAGAEALARWPQGDGEEPIGPDVFIPMAEELGLMDQIGFQVFEASCRHLRAWEQQPWSQDFWISVNVTPSQLQNPMLAVRFVDIARTAGVSPKRFMLEVTESAFEEGFNVSGPLMDELATAGFSLALDDFGTGHSSLNRLITMPFHVLKVDRTFVSQILAREGAAVVSSMAQLASSLKLVSLGEGVETEAHEHFLRDCGYAFAQGYRYSEPLSADGFGMWCSRNDDFYSAGSRAESNWA